MRARLLGISLGFMTRNQLDPLAPDTPAAAAHVCPFCGHVAADNPQPCPRCGLVDSPATRQGIQTQVGPWFVLQDHNPAAPGISLAILLERVAQGQVAAASVVRGPTTGQLWSRADRVRGLSRHLGLCHACGHTIDAATSLCPHCQQSQDPPADPDLWVDGAGRNLPSSPAEFRQEPILSARDLATAFDLQFDPSPRAPSSQLWLKLLIAVLLLAVVGAVGFSANPQWWDAITDAWRGSPPPPPAGVNPAPEHRLVPAPVPTRPAVTTTSAATTRSPAPARPATVASQPAFAVPQPSSAPTTRAASPAPRPAALPASAPATQPASQRVPAIDPTEALSLSRTLYRAAIDAESQQDFRTAVQRYEQIQKLPPSVWQSDLQQRLTQARSRIK